MIERRRFGPAGGGAPEVPTVGQGTWKMDRDDRRAAVTALRRGLDLGMTHIDTAELYGDAEGIAGEAIAGRRDTVFLVSKVMPQNASRAGTAEACERSLARLGTDRLDCYLLHWPGRHRLEDTFGAFERLRREGKIRSWGVSNFDVPDLEAAVPATRDLGGVGEGRLVCNQVLYHLQERAIEGEVLPWCERHGVAVVGYSPFGQGRFPGAGTPGGRVLQEVAAAHGHGATPRQVALAFLVRRPGLFTIPKSGQPGHVEENAGGGGLRLTAEEVGRIDAAFPPGRRGRGLPML